MTAYYNEIDPYAAEWLRNLIAHGHIANGVVDTRSISEIEPNELREFTQCHFFAGVGVWSHALRLAGWPDDRPVWTGSCPCQPFSSAGRAGGFTDERHLWPHWQHLIRERRPGVVFGEQVASPDGLTWLDLVHADLEGEGYAVSAVDLCAAGVGAPHIRQRLYFVADTNLGIGREGRADIRGRIGGGHAQPRAGSLGDGLPNRMADANNKGPQRHGRPIEIHAAQGRQDAPRHSAEVGEPNRVANANGEQQRPQGQPTERNEHATAGRHQSAATAAGLRDDFDPAATNGHWRTADWLFCRDGKWRAVEPGTFPLAHGATARVGRLRAYGNAIVPQVAAQVIGAYMDARGFSV